MDNLILLLASWIPVAGVVLALCIGPDDDCAVDEGHREPGQGKTLISPVFKPVAVTGGTADRHSGHQFRSHGAV